MPERTCVGCRAVAESDGLVRLAVTDGDVVVDAARRLPGRGAWLHPSSACLEAALRRRSIPRVLRAAVDPTVLRGQPPFDPSQETP